MEWITNIFSTRELAIVLWVVIAFAVCVIWKKTRKNIWDVIKSAFCKKFVQLYLCIVAYSALIIYVLSLLKYWDWLLLKDSILSMIFIALVSCFKIILNKDRVRFLKELIIDAIKWTAIVQFVTSTYNFNFFVEFIVLFILFFIGCLSAVAERDEKNKAVVKLCNALLIIYGLISIIFSLNQAIHDYQNFITVATLKSFLLPIIMSLLYLPFIYFFAMHCLYEEIFMRLKFVVRKDKKLLRYFKLKTKLNFCFRLRKLESFRVSALFTRELFTSKQDIDNFFNEIKIINQRAYKLCNKL